MYFTIYLLQDHYDKMIEGDGKTGSVLYFEPLQVELNDCFGSLKNITPDSVFSAQKGLIEKIKTSQEVDKSGETEKSEKCNRQSKSNFIIISFQQTS